MDSMKPKSVGSKLLSVALPFAGATMLAGVIMLACRPHLVVASTVNVAPAPVHATTNAMWLEVADGRSDSDAKAVKIFDNLAKSPSGTYWGEVEFVIVGGGGNSTFPDDQFAAAFTPSASHTATKIEVGVVSSGLGYGSTGFTLSLNKDDKGVPGKALLTAQLPGLPNNGRGWCCALVIGHIPNGIALSGGKQYWIVLNGQAAQSADAAGWVMNATDQLHPFLDAEYCSFLSRCPKGAGWYPFQGTPYGTGAAFAVLGK